MPAPLSVVIPTRNAAGIIGPTLGSLAEALQAGLLREVILADAGTGDGMAEIAEATGARLVTAPPGRGSQLRAGVAAARGAWILVLHADSVPGPGWTAAVLAHMAERPGEAAHFRLRFDATGVAPALVAGWANLRSRLLGLPYGDQGLLVPRPLYDRAGGYPPIPLMEDVAIVRALARAQGRRLRALQATIVTSAARYRREGWTRRGARNLGTLMRYALGVPPDRLAHRHEGGGHD